MDMIVVVRMAAMAATRLIDLLVHVGDGGCEDEWEVGGGLEDGIHHTRQSPGQEHTILVLPTPLGDC